MRQGERQAGVAGKPLRELVGSQPVALVGPCTWPLPGGRLLIVLTRTLWRSNTRVGLAAVLVLGLAVSLLATPSFAQQSNSGEAGMSSERENALRDRTGQAGKMSQSTWGDQQIHKYRSCMAQHGQQE